MTVAIENDVPELADVSPLSRTVHEDALNNFDPTHNVDGDDIEGSTGNPESGQTTQQVFSYANLLALVDVGADEEITFSLNQDPTTFDGTATGVTSKGDAVSWNVDSATKVSGVAADGRIVFTLEQTAGTGTDDPTDDAFTFTLIDQVDHLTELGDADASVTVDVGDAFVATDFDGDEVVLDGAVTVAIENDVPVNISPMKAFVSNSGDATGSGALNLPPIIGADEPGDVVFNITDTTVLQDTSSNDIKIDNQQIFLFVESDGHVLRATTSSTNADPVTNTVFTITLDPGDDTYTITFLKAINDGSGTFFDDFAGLTGGNQQFFPLNSSTDPTSPEDLLITPTIPGTNTINTDNDDVGVGNQHLNNGTGEIIRLDFVLSVGGTSTDISTLTYTDHFDVNDAGFRVHQLQGNKNTPRSVLVKVYDDDEDLQGAAYNGTEAAEQDDIISAAVVTVAGITFSAEFDGTDVTFTVFAADGSTLAGPTTVANGTAVNFGGRTITFTFDDDNNGGIRIDGLLTDDQVAVSTANGFNQMEILNVTVGGNLGIALDNFAFGATALGNQVDMTIPLTVTDKDGDQSSGTLDVTTVPVAFNIVGDSEGNALIGDSLNDVLIGLGGDDILTGGAGNDTLQGGPGDDTIDGGLGTDLLDFSDGVVGIAFELNSGGTDADGFFTFNTGGAGLGIDNYKGIEGVIGTDSADTLTGDGGANILIGGGGNDILIGGGDDDILIGGLGADTLTGGAGADRFVFTLITEAGDTITDFSEGDGDLIDIADLLDSLGFVFSTDTNSDWVRVNSGDNSILEVDTVGGIFANAGDVVQVVDLNVDFSTTNIDSLITAGVVDVNPAG